MLRTHISKVLPVLALVICAGKMQAVTLVGPTTLALTCDTVIGPVPATVGITLAAAGALNVTATDASSPLIVLPSPATISVTSTSSATNFTFSAAAGCKGLVVGTPSTVTLTFTPATGTAISVTATVTVTNSGSALAPSPSPVTLTCTRSVGVDTAVATQTVNVTSPANSGTPFYVDQATVPSTIFGITGGGTTGSPVTASATPVALTLTLVSGCGSLLAGSTTYTVHLLTNAPVTTASLTVTVQVGSTATLTPSPTSISLTYTKGSGTYTPVTSSVSATPLVYFTVGTLPLWLNVTPTAATTTSPVVVSFVPTAGAETLAVGSYSANVHLSVSGAVDVLVPVTLLVKNPAATLSVSEGITRTLSWTLGTALPVLKVTPISSDSPIAYTVTTGAGSLSPQVSATSGLAYNFGSPITVSFLQSTFGGAAPGTALSGTVIITPASGPVVTVTITVNVLAANAMISGLSPAALPTAITGSYTVILSGSGFAFTGGVLTVTKVGIVSGGQIVADANFVPVVNNSGSVTLTIYVPATTDVYLPFSGSGGTVLIGVCNPQGVGCVTPTSTLALAIGVNPLVQTITSSSSYIQAASPALTAVAPYDILSIFGTNFCVSGGTGCVGTTPVLYGATDPSTVRYPLSLSPDAVSADAAPP